MDARAQASRNQSPEERDRRYTAYLIIVALAGWSLASYDLNLLVLVAGAISLVVLISVLQVMNMPEYGRSILYGVVVLLILLLYGRERREA